MTALATLLADPSRTISYVVELVERDPDTDVETTRRYQTPNRTASDGYPPLLSDPGGRNDRLEVDELEAIAAQTVAPVKLANQPASVGAAGPLDFLRHRTLSGRAITIYAGAAEEAFANYEAVASSVVDREPVFDGTVVEVRIKSPLNRLDVDLEVGTYVGEPGALKILTGTGVATAADNAAHHLTSFTLAGRFRHPTGSGATAPRVSARQTSSTARNWLVNLGAFSGGSAGRLVASYSSGGVANALSFVSTARYDDDLVHSWVFARGPGHAYLMADAEVVAESTSPAMPDSAVVAGVAMGLGFNVGPGWINDERLLNHYVAPDEMRAAMGVRADGGEAGMVGLWRGDDNTGATLTDYSSTGAHATVSGTEGVDFEWVSSDLGTAELAGSSMAALFGEVFHAPADLVDPDRERWRVADGPFLSTSWRPSKVRDEGEELATPADYDWEAADAVIELTAEAGEPLTVGGPISTTATVDTALFDRLVDRGAFAQDQIRFQRFLALHPVDFGLWSRRRSVASVLRDVLGGSLSHLTALPDGTLRFDTLCAPTSPGPRDGACIEIAAAERFNSHVDDERSKVLWSRGANILTSRDFTLACWVKTHRWGPDEIGVNALPLVALTGAGDNVSFEVRPTGGTQALLLRRDSGISTLATASAGIGQMFSVDDGSQWWFVAVTHSHTAGETRFYGAPLGSSLALLGVGSSLGYTVTPPVQSAQIGHYTFAQYFRGGIAEPRAWNSVRSLTELQGEMTTVLAGSETGLAFYVPLDGLSSAALTDTVSGTLGVASVDVRQVPDLVLDLDEAPYAFRSRRLRPAHRIEVRYARNYAVLSPPNIAATVDQETALSLQREWKAVVWSNPAVAADVLDAREVAIDSPWANAAGATATARIARHRFALGRELAEIEGANRRALLLGINDEVRVYGSRWGLDTGSVYRVAANHARFGELTCDLELWR